MIHLVTRYSYRTVLGLYFFHIPYYHVVLFSPFSYSLCHRHRRPLIPEFIHYIVLKFAQCMFEEGVVCIFIFLLRFSRYCNKKNTMQYLPCNNNLQLRTFSHRGISFISILIPHSTLPMSPCFPYLRSHPRIRFRARWIDR